MTGAEGGVPAVTARRRSRRGERVLAGVGMRARGLRVEIAGRVLLDEVDFEIESGEVVALLGPNGAGKSTLLACLAGDRTPTSGDVELDGAPLSTWSPRQRAQRRAVLTQQAQVAFPFTAAEVVRMGRAPWAGTPEAATDSAVVDASLREADVADLADRTFPALSGGERARVAFARLLAQRTPVLLLDEPTAALDLGHQEQLLQTVRARADAGAAVVVVVHDLSLAAAWADRVVLLHGGRTVATGSARAVLTEETVSRVYGHPVTVLDDPATGAPLVIPRRTPRSG